MVNYAGEMRLAVEVVDLDGIASGVAGVVEVFHRSGHYVCSNQTVAVVVGVGGGGGAGAGDAIPPLPTGGPAYALAVWGSAEYYFDSIDFYLCVCDLAFRCGSSVGRHYCSDECCHHMSSTKRAAICCDD